MIFNFYTIKDELSDYSAPITIEDDAQAKRFFRYKVETTKMMSDNPEDFSIWCNGKFDTETGEITAEPLKLIERAKSVK